ncbi:MAG: RidA family protein [Pseudomonadota bacterium]
MSRRLISTGSPFEARAGYSRAVVQDTPIGRWCFVSGTTGYDYASMSMPDDAYGQARNALGTIETALKDAGLALSDVHRVRCYVVSPEVFEAVVPALGAAFREIRPANTTIVSALVAPEMKVEIEVDAFRPAE